jgi:tetratricopeptide (TPR) repeat protein
LFHIFEGESGTGQVRTQLWQADARLLLENPAIQFPDGTADPLHLIRPLIGYGLDSMPLVYNQLRLPEPAFNNEDHSHNETWDVLLTTGLLGVLAYQVLYLSLFLYGLRYLGLLANRRESNTLIGLWAGCGTLGVLIAIGLGQPKYMGLGLPLGNVLGLIAYLGSQILRRQPAEQGMNNSSTGRILAGAILASLLAHYVEAQFGLNLVTTQVLFWACAGILSVLIRDQFALAQRTPTASQTPGSRRSAQFGSAASYAFIAVVILTTLLFEFVVFDNVDRAPLSLLWRSLTFSPTLGYATYAALAVFVATWAGAVLLSVSEMALSSASATPQPRHWLKIGGTVAALSICLALVFAIGLCVQVSTLPNIPLPVTDMQQPASLAQQLINITDYYLCGIVLLTLLTALALVFEADARQLRWSSRWGWVTVLPLALVTLVWANIVDLNPIRADVYYKVGRYFEDQNQWDVSIPLYARAIQLSPVMDVYPMALGNVLQNRANASKPEPAVRFSDRTDLQEVLTLNEQQMIELKRLDFLYAAQTAFLHALDLNPLFPLHTLNLARFYTPELPIDSEAKTKLADLAGRYYAEATRLSPGNVLLWNEWATLDLDRQDPDGALAKIEESLRLVPSFDETYVTQGKIYSAKNDLEQAATAYRQAINLKPDSAEAYSRLAFIDYQQGRLSEAAEAFLAYIDRAATSPNLWEAHKNLALIYQDLGDVQQAIAHAQQAVSLAPTEAQAQLAELVARLQPSATPTP